MNEFYNCNFKRDDIIIGINPENKFSYLKIFRIKDFVTHEEYGRTIVTFAIVDYVTENEICTDLHTTDIGVSFLNKNFRRINVEEV